MLAIKTSMINNISIIYDHENISNFAVKYEFSAENEIETKAMI